jgi:hypothetical protein
MRRSATILILTLIVSIALVNAQDTARVPAGFSRASADANAKFEKIVLDTPTPANAHKWLQALTE